MNFIDLLQNSENMFNKLSHFKKDSFLFLVGLIIFTGLNIFSAVTMELHPDEAYYWLYSQFPSMGYFDHPPMIAWLIMAGQFLLKKEIGIRILILLCSTFSMVFLWKMAKKYSTDALLFWSLIYSIILIHPYSFIATPDAPLMFFSILFFYFYSRYLKKNNFQNTVILSFIIALMIYSKYHALLLLGFVLLSNIKQLKKVSFWSIIILALIYLLPHIFWQLDNHFLTFRYQLYEGHKNEYNITITLKYILSELAVTGPFLGWFYLYAMTKVKSENDWEKALQYSGIGIFIFFLISTYKGDFEAHWTLVAIIPLILLSFKYITQNPKWKKWVIIAGTTNFILLLLVRIIILTPLSRDIKVISSFTGNRTEASIIKNFTGNNQVIYQDAWTDASRFAFYVQDKNVDCLNSGLYRKNQFEIFNHDESFEGETVVVLTLDSLQLENSTKIITNKSIWYGKKIDDFHSYYKLTFNLNITSVKNNLLKASVTIHNSYDDTLRLGDTYNLKSSFRLYTHELRKWIVLKDFPVNDLIILPHSNHNLDLKFDLSNSLLSKKNTFLTLKVGELNPIPTSYKIDLLDGSFKRRE
jgi:hypothetical protein